MASRKEVRHPPERLATVSIQNIKYRVIRDNFSPLSLYSDDELKGYALAMKQEGYEIDAETGQMTKDGRLVAVILALKPLDLNGDR